MWVFILLSLFGDNNVEWVGHIKNFFTNTDAILRSPVQQQNSLMICPSVSLGWFALCLEWKWDEVEYFIQPSALLYCYQWQTILQICVHSTHVWRFFGPFGLSLGGSIFATCPMRLAARHQLFSPCFVVIFLTVNAVMIGRQNFLISSCIFGFKNINNNSAQTKKKEQ